MERTVAANSERIISRALELLDGARRIHLVGVGASSLVARDFSYKLMQLGRNVLHDSDSHIQMANASTLGPVVVLFAISYSVARIESLRIAELASKRVSMVIAVSGMHD